MDKQPPQEDGPDVLPKDVQAAERRYIIKRRATAGLGRSKGKASALDDATGLALSGGGIRSACFCLGVMQALSRWNILKRFDYLSTVSGGGYAGASLSWWTGRKNTAPRDFGTEKDNFPYGTDDPAGGGGPDRGDQKMLMRFLRAHGNYLTPGRGLTLATILAVIARNVSISLFLWVFTLTSLFVTLRYLLPSHKGCLHDTHCLTEVPWYWTAGWLTPTITVAKIFILCSIVYFLMPRQLTPKQKESNWHYLLRRQLEGGPFRILFAGGLLLGAFGVIPHTVEGLRALFGAGHHVAFATTLSMIASGASIGAWAVTRLRTSSQGILAAIAPPLGAALLVFGLLILSYHLAGTLLLAWAGAVLPTQTTPISELGHAPWIAGLAAIGIALTIARCIPANYVSIGRFYRDRLMESFLPDWEAVKANSNAAARQANLAFIQNIPDPDRPRGPLHLVNTNVVLKDSPKPAHQQRLGDDFVFSPVYCGGPVTGWAKAADYLRGQMTLATTMAISGAAVNPHSGVSGGGVSAGFLHINADQRINSIVKKTFYFCNGVF